MKAPAGLIPVIGRNVDAVTDPAMGRISDRTFWRGGPVMWDGWLSFDRNGKP